MHAAFHDFFPRLLHHVLIGLGVGILGMIIIGMLSGGEDLLRHFLAKCRTHWRSKFH